MSGFTQDPIQFINLIADNLRDRYQTGFPVLKELIQNSDDAPASELHYGLSSGFVEAKHPLLRGPGLFLINNGAFKPSDARGIRSFGQNSKAADQGSIGKFGLGMKSVFHFCEAFFFLAHDGERAYSEILNPWSGAEPGHSLHADWDDFSDEDARRIRSHLQPITTALSSAADRSFILWLPLRQKRHLELPSGERAGAIVSEYPGDDPALLDFLNEADLGIRIAALMPLLRHLKGAVFWRQEGDQAGFTPSFEVQLRDGGKSASLIGSKHDQVSMEALSPCVIDGRIHIIQGGERCKLEFAGLEYMAWNSSLRAMHDHELWPSSYVRDELGRSREAKDKAQPHGAVFFSRAPGEGSLTTSWSVFLPLDENSSSQTIHCDGNHDFRLTLHGYFFVDAGRQGVHGLKAFHEHSNGAFDSEEALRRAWNVELLKSVVLPMVLPALDRFCSEVNLGDKAKTNLTQALTQSRDLKQFNEQITGCQCWLREITLDGPRWALKSNEKKVLRLPPAPEGDPSRPWRLFPALGQFARQYWLAAEGAPNIINRELEAQWDDLNLSTLIGSVEVKALFGESTLLDYFYSFLRDSAGPYLNVGTVIQALELVVRRGLIQVGEESLGQNESRVRQVIGYLDVSRCLRVENQLSTSLLGSLLSASSDVLLIPSRFWPADWQQETSLSHEHVLPLLQSLQSSLSPQSTVGKVTYDAAVKLAEQLIKSVTVEARPALLRRCSELYVLRAFDCQANKMRAASPQEVESASVDGLLFGYAQGTTHVDRLALAPQLQRVIPYDRILVINAETAKLALGVERSLRPCNGHFALQTLGQKPRKLADMTLRAKLAGQLGEPVDEVTIRGLRYLLHAQEDYFEASDPLWILGDEQHPVWLQLWAQIVGEEPWNLLAGGIADRLSREVARSVGIKEIRADAVVEEIAEKGAYTLNSAGFEQEDCEQVLSAITDDDLWLSVPFHWTRDERPISAKAGLVFLEPDDLELEEQLLDSAKLIVKSQDSDIRRRQERLLRKLDHGAFIGLALDRSDATDIWRGVLDRLQRTQETGEPLSKAMVGRIRSERWLPSVSGTYFSPEDVIDFGGDAGLDRILAQSPGSFVTPTGLTFELQQHPFFSCLREHYFSRAQAGVERLALALDELDAYQIGSVRFDDSASLAQAARLLSSSSHLGWRLLANLDDLIGAEVELMALASGMLHPMSLEATTALLVWVANQGPNNKELISVFNRYLKLFAEMEGAPAELHRLKLMNQAGKWAESGALAGRGVGIAPAYVLHQRQADILSHLLNARADVIEDGAGELGLPAATQPSATAAVLRDYFQNWSGRVAPALTGALVLLFGGEDSVKALCRDLLGQHSREWLIAQLPWKTAVGVDSNGTGAWLRGYTLERALDYFRMTVRVHDSERVNVNSIIGTSISVEVDKEFDSIFIDKPSYCSLGGDRGYRVDLIVRKLDVDQLSDKELSRVLQASMGYLLREVYEQQGTGLDDLWGQLDTADQVDIELARSLILRNIPFYLKQLGAHKHPNLTAGLSRFRDEERKEQEHKGTSKEATFRRTKEEALSELQTIIESEPGIQQAILGSVRRKVKDFQYQAESIPFELFQNADDALHYLSLIEAYPSEPNGLDVDPLPPSICRFSIETDGNRISFMHWGRAINQFGTNGYPGREHGFDRDLENILILSASDKSDDVTGKFGLGFKSVWLATERPVLVSGRLQAEIVGGLLPTAASSTLAQPLRRRMKEIQPDNRWPGTAISLPLVDVVEKDVLGSFFSVAGTMVAFARHIQRIDIVESGQPSSSFSWAGEVIPESDHISVGALRHGRADLLVMKIALPEGAVLVGVGPEGFVSLPKDLPTIWVTAPIREQDRLGFAVNAMFEVDAGRSRLSASLDENRSLAHRLGKQFAGVIETLRVAVQKSWGELANLMQFEPTMTPYRFWLSLWATLMERWPDMPRDSGSKVIAEELLGEGLNQLATVYGLIPNGLKPKLSYLLNCGEVRAVLNGALLDPTIQEVVSAAPCFKTLIDPKHTITSDVSKWLRVIVPEFATSKTQWQSESLCSLILKLEGHQAVTYADASVLGRGLNQATLKQWEKDGEKVPHQFVKDYKAAAAIGPLLRFISEAGLEAKARTLLSQGGNEEESLRWAFAPNKNRLGRKYSGEAVDFFFWCRDRLDAPSDKLKQWVLSAEDDNRRCAALRYLVEGELAREVADALHESGIEGSWLAVVDEQSVYLQGWDSTKRSKLLYQVLKTPDQSREAWLSRDSGAYSEPDPIDPEAALQNIHDWWEEVRDEKLKKYSRDTYPDGRPLRLAEDDRGCIDRSSWLTLLLLGGFHTMGRVKSVQHRQFIENCQRKGWWDVFTDPKPAERFDDWMKVLDQYIDQQDDQQEYEQWMLRFPIIYKLSRHLDDYVDLLVELDRYANDFDLELVLKPRVDPSQQGGGISAPALARSLGIGANFVVRELIRHQIIDSKHLRKHAYVPTSRVKQLLFEMGCVELEWEPQLKASARISSFLVRQLGEKKSCFCRDFDIPLKLVAADGQLQHELLGRQLRAAEEW